MGGVISLYIAMEFAEIFGYGLIFSPAMHLYGENTLEKLFGGYDFAEGEFPALYLYAGASKGGSPAGSPYDESCITKYVSEIKDALTGRGYPAEKIGAKIEQTADHSESSWANAFPVAMQWLGEIIP